MSPAGHLRLLTMGTLTWVAFWAAGLPSYYQQYSVASMLAFELALLVAIIALLPRLFRPLSPDRRLRAAVWMSLYFTVPLAFYDWLYCGVHLGHGWAFLWRYWYLTVYYVVPWIVLPAVAARINRRSPATGAA